MSNELRTAVRFILRNASKFEWSLQGLGMLRLHMGDETRLHVWDRQHAFPGASPIHDHLQWHLRSRVISGRIMNVRYIEHEHGQPFLYSTLKAGYGCYFKHEPLPIRLMACAPEIYTAGETYSQRPDEIHESQPVSGTVTIMTKTPTEDGESARIFWPQGTEWGSAEPRIATPDEVAAITSYALALMDAEQ